MSERCGAVCLLLVTAAVLCLAGCAAQPKAGDIRVNPKDGAEMVWVPAGEFLMGSTGEDIARLVKHNPGAESQWFEDEKPQRKVYLDGFWMYKTEVTVAQYRRFCEETKRKMLQAPDWGWQDDHPMVRVDWQDAADYAQWAGATLPTEAQWEKAARGTTGRVFPWGGKWPPTKIVGNFLDKSFLRDQSQLRQILGRGLKEDGFEPLRGYDDGHAFTAPVGSYPAGVSPYGCLDLAGNVSEWCADWYDEEYYGKSSAKNPPGPANGDFRVMRGGSWLYERVSYFYITVDCRCAQRLSQFPDSRYYDQGFRCAMTP